MYIYVCMYMLYVYVYDVYDVCVDILQYSRHVIYG